MYKITSNSSETHYSKTSPETKTLTCNAQQKQHQLVNLLWVFVLIALILLSSTAAKASTPSLWRDQYGQLYLDAHANVFYAAEASQPFSNSEGQLYVLGAAGERYYLQANQQTHNLIWTADGEAIAVYSDVQAYHLAFMSNDDLHFTSPSGSPYKSANDQHFYVNAQGFPYCDSNNQLYVVDDSGHPFYLSNSGVPYNDHQGLFLVDAQGAPVYLATN